MTRAAMDDGAVMEKETANSIPFRAGGLWLVRGRAEDGGEGRRMEA